VEIGWNLWGMLPHLLPQQDNRNLSIRRSAKPREACFGIPCLRVEVRQHPAPERRHHDPRGIRLDRAAELAWLGLDRAIAYVHRLSWS